VQSRPSADTKASRFDIILAQPQKSQISMTTTNKPQPHSDSSFSRGGLVVDSCFFSGGLELLSWARAPLVWRSRASESALLLIHYVPQKVIDASRQYPSKFSSNVDVFSMSMVTSAPFSKFTVSSRLKISMTHTAHTCPRAFCLEPLLS
jgi:hypothetical protein